MSGPLTVPYNFGGIPHERSEYDAARVVVLPVPYDGTVTYLSGTRCGPRAIIEASRNMELYDEELKGNISTVGITTLDELEPTASPAEMVKRVEEAARRVWRHGKFLVVLGGEHSITPGVVRAAREFHPGLSVLLIDAHADLRKQYQGSPCNHACTAARLTSLCPVVQVGVRSFSEEEVIAVEAQREQMLFAADIVGRTGWEQDVITRLTGELYVSIDLDALDPGIMPAVGTPEPGGLGWYELLRLLRTVAGERTIVGFDVVELRPMPGNPAPDFLAAKLTYKLIGYATHHSEEE